MKKFFKALALVLALTLVIGVIPASAADAKVATSKLLYIGGAKGVSADGTDASTVKAKVAIYKLAGYTKDTKVGHKFAAEVTGKEGVVEITKNYVIAAGMGKTTVDILVDGEVAGTTTITVKKNAEETIALTGLEDGQEVVAGQTVTVSLPRSGKDTDARRLTCNGVAVAENADAARTFEVKFPAVGEYKIVGEAFQSAKYDGATGSATVTVKAVAPKAVSAKQVSTDTFEITFESDMTGLISKENFGADSVYTKIGTTNIAQGLVKDVKVEGEVVTVVMYNALNEKTEYFVAPTSNEVSFKTAESKLENVASIKVTVDAAYKGEDTPISYKYFNADGVELSQTLIVNAPVITVTSDFAWLTTKASKPAVYFFESGKTAVVKAVLAIGYDAETNEIIEVADEVEVTSYDKAVAALTSRDYSFGTADADKNVHTVRLNNTGATSAVKIQYNYSEGNPDKITLSSTDYKLESADEKIAMIKNSVEVIGVNTGSTTIIVYKKATDGSWAVVDALPIVIAEKNHGKYADITLSQNTVNIDHTASVSDAATIDVKAYDLDGDEYAATEYTVTVKQIENNAAATGYDLADDSTTLDSVSITTNGSRTPKEIDYVRFTVKVTDNNNNNAVLAEKTMYVSVADYASSKANSYEIFATKTALDASLTYNETVDKLAASSVITVKSSYNGFNCGPVAFTTIDKLSNIPTVASAATIYYVSLTTPKDAEAALYQLDAGAYNAANANGNSITIKNLISGKQATAGTYTVQGMKVVYDANDKLTSRVSLGSASVSVTKNDSVPTVEIVKGEMINKNDTTAFKAYWCGLNSEDDAEVTIKAVNAIEDTNGAIYVYDVTVTVDANVYGSYDHTVKINKLFK